MKLQNTKRGKVRNDTFYWTGKVRNVMNLNVLRLENVPTI